MVSNPNEKLIIRQLMWDPVLRVYIDNFNPVVGILSYDLNESVYLTAQ